MQETAQGPWGIRFLIRLFTLLLGVLAFWLLGFVVRDIESIKGPEYGETEKKHVDPALVQKAADLNKQIAGLEREIANKREEQRLVGESSQNLQRTITQLLDLQKLSIEKAVALSDEEKSNLSTSLKHFLESQRDYQELNQEIAGLTSRKQALAAEKGVVDEQVETQKKPAQKEFRGIMDAHRMRLAFYQLMVLVPLLLVAGFLLVRRRDSVYFPVLLACGGATLVKVGLVIHEYFPSRYFKYVLILILLAIVARILIHLIRIVTYPKLDWLARQYREAYERFLCPVCEYPIRTGPRRFLYWTRRTVRQVVPPACGESMEQAYTCPACGTLLYEACVACGKTRHSMLGHCEHCGAEKQPG
jgi:hypothetical protein